MSMKLTFRATRRVLAGAALATATALVPATALAATTAPGGHVAPGWPAPRCTAGQTEIWLGVGGGGGTAGTIFFPLQFTNIGRHTCSLIGFPKVAAISARGHQIGKSSRAIRLPHGFVVLPPGFTAHASLGIVEAGNVCSHPVSAAALRVRAPHQGRSTVIPFAFQACRGKRVLVVGPVRPGVGIP
jgi:hypothetical protein